jgi:hypothetical protein
VGIDTDFFVGSTLSHKFPFKKQYWFRHKLQDVSNPRPVAVAVAVAVAEDYYIYISHEQLFIALLVGGTFLKIILVPGKRPR